MTTEDSGQKSNFVVKDRRRFDDAGNERPEDSTGGSSTEAASKVSKAEPRSVKAPESRAVPQESRTRSSSDQASSHEGVSEINFSSFVISLATQTLMQLGEMKPPHGVEIPVDRVGAKNTIDILSMLEEKTKGNLEKDEERLIEEVLHNLRLSFVRGAK